MMTASCIVLAILAIFATIFAALFIIASRLDQRQAEIFFDRGQRENFDIERDRQ